MTTGWKHHRNPPGSANLWASNLPPPCHASLSALNMPSVSLLSQGAPLRQPSPDRRRRGLRAAAGRWRAGMGWGRVLLSSVPFTLVMPLSALADAAASARLSFSLPANTANATPSQQTTALLWEGRPSKTLGKTATKDNQSQEEVDASRVRQPIGGLFRWGGDPLHGGRSCSLCCCTFCRVQGCRSRCCRDVWCCLSYTKSDGCLFSILCFPMTFLFLYSSFIPMQVSHYDLLSFLLSLSTGQGFTGQRLPRSTLPLVSRTIMPFYRFSSLPVFSACCFLLCCDLP